MRLCMCNCGKPVKGQRLFINGHNPRGVPRTEEHRQAIGDGQRRAWKKRKRMPVGSTRIDARGYVVEKVHPSSGHWQRQHILVMERHIGRKLASEEVVHHINGVRSDNRLENLYLCRDRSHHNDVHRSEVEVFRLLLERGVVRFAGGRYEADL